MSDLSHLFPNLANDLQDWDGRQAVSDGHDDPSHAGVTDEQIDNYLRSVGSLRAPLSPVISGQQVPASPQFAAGQGRSVPPPPSHMEPPQASETPLEAPVPPQEGVEAVEEPEEPPEPGEGFQEAAAPPPPSDTVQLGGRHYDRKQAEAWALFDQIVESDPQFRQYIQEYLQKRFQQPQPQPQPPSTIYQPAAERFELPTLPPEYAQDETIQNLYKAVQAQQQHIDRISHQAAQAERYASHQIQRTYADIAKGAMTEFQKTHNLPDDAM